MKKMDAVNDLKKPEVRQTHTGSGDLVGGDQTKNIRYVKTKAYYEAPAAVTIPRHLTPKPFFNAKDFKGRKDDLDEVYQKLFDSSINNNCLLLVNGEGGIGKTTLASCYYHRHHSTYRHQAWLLGEGDIRSAVVDLGPTLGLSFAEDADQNTRFTQTLTQLANLEQTGLIVFDNANSLEDLKQLTPLFTLSNFHILITSRLNEYDQVETLKIRSLSKDVALQVFQSHYPQHSASDNDYFFAIYDAVGGNTLVIELLAKYMKVMNKLKQQYSLANLLEQLQAQGLLALDTKKVNTNYQQLRKETPEAIISAMYDMDQLEANDRKWLANFAVLPPENIPYAYLEGLVNDLTLEDSLLNLSEMGWLEFDEKNKGFKCSPVIQEICKRKEAESLDDHCQMMMTSLIDDFLDYDEGGHLKKNDSHIEVFVHYAAHIGEAIPRNNHKIGILNERLGNYYSTIGDLYQALSYQQKYMSVLKALWAEDPADLYFKNGLAISYSKLGETHTALGNLEQALGFFDTETELFEELYEANPTNVAFKNGLAISYVKLAGVYEISGEVSKARDFYQKAKTLWESLVSEAPDFIEFRKNLSWVIEKLSRL